MGQTAGTGPSSHARVFHLELIKPSHYDDDGYVIQWAKAWIPSNSLSSVYALALDVAERKVGASTGQVDGEGLADARRGAGDGDGAVAEGLHGARPPQASAVAGRAGVVRRGARSSASSTSGARLMDR